MLIGNFIKMNIPAKIKNQIWWLIINCDFDTKRIVIGCHEIDSLELTLYLEDNLDFKDTLDEMVCLSIPIREFARVILDNNHLYDKRFKKAPISWYQEEANPVQQKISRELMLEKVIHQLVNIEIKPQISNE